MCDVVDACGPKLSCFLRQVVPSAVVRMEQSCGKCGYDSLRAVIGPNPERHRIH